MAQANMNKLKNIFKKEYHSFILLFIPQKYMNMHILHYQYPKDIKLSYSDDEGNKLEIGCVQYSAVIYPCYYQNINNLNVYQSMLKDKEIIPMFQLNVYLPCVNKKVVINDKNLNKYAFYDIQMMKTFYQQWNKKQKNFQNFLLPNHEYENLEKETMKFASEIITQSNMVKDFENSMKKIIITPDFKEFNNEILPLCYDLNDFLKIDELQQYLQKKQLDPTIITKRQHEFILKIKQMF